MDLLIILRIFVGMLLGPTLLLFFNVLIIMSHVSSGLIDFIEKLFSVRVFRFCAKSFLVQGKVS